MRNARGTPEPKEPPQIGGGTFGSYPTFRTSASLSHGSPLPSHPPTHSYTEAAKTRDETPHPASSATHRSLFPDDVVHSNTSTSLIHRTDEDPSSISSSRRFSHPVLHLQGAALTFPSSF